MECVRKIGDKEIKKIQYDTLDDAIKVAKTINSKPHQIHKVVSYKCTICYKYHIGKNGKLLKDKDKNIYKP